MHGGGTWDLPIIGRFVGMGPYLLRWMYGLIDKLVGNIYLSFIFRGDLIYTNYNQSTLICIIAKY